MRTISADPGPGRGLPLVLAAVASERAATVHPVMVAVLVGLVSDRPGVVSAVCPCRSVP